MAPVAGSAYTYAYATLGEMFAWIIGWDLILEYAVSNMAVSVGFSAHVVGLLDWFGIHPNPRWISPAYLPSGLSDFSGNELYPPAMLLALLILRPRHRALWLPDDRGGAPRRRGRGTTLRQLSIRITNRSARFGQAQRFFQRK